MPFYSEDDYLTKSTKHIMKKIKERPAGNGTKPNVRRSAKKKAKNKIDVTIHLFGKSFKATM